MIQKDLLMTCTQIEYQAELLVNRLNKRYKHLRKWAKRENTLCYRLYDKDIPEIPLCIDFIQSIDNEIYLHISLYERPYEKDDTEEEQWLNSMKAAASKAVNVPETNIFLKTRKKQHFESQYEKISRQSKIIITKERDHKFIINLSDYLDYGLFLDHRPLRKIIQDESANKNILNLFCYTSSFSIYAAYGNASRIDSVDLSKTYIDWSKENMKMNNFNQDKFPKYSFIEKDVIEYISKCNTKYDIIILDPPTFSNSKKTSTVLDINRDWPEIIENCIDLLNSNGVLYFSTNSRQIHFDTKLLPKNTECSDITESSIPEDFRNKKIHHLWKITNYN